VNIHSGPNRILHPFPPGIFIHITSESLFTSLRNDYSHAPESASEMVALFAREEVGAKIVGTATPGRLVSHAGFKLGHGFTLALPVAAYVSWAGTRVDETGIEPDVTIDWSYSDARYGVDNQVIAAIAVAKTIE
jgi:C-terminal processing protease CtpA/Prc